jgi:hypothetical protein
MTDDNGHDHRNPDSLLNRLSAEFEGVEAPCEFCKPERVRVIPASGTRWVLGVEHQEGCPDFVPD